MGKPTFPDQQQDLQNAASYKVTGQCDGSVKFAEWWCLTNAGKESLRVYSDTQFKGKEEQNR
jgi:hypothetical protein